MLDIASSFDDLQAQYTMAKTELYACLKTIDQTDAEPDCQPFEQRVDTLLKRLVVFEPSSSDELRKVMLFLLDEFLEEAEANILSQRLQEVIEHDVQRLTGRSASSV